MRPEHEQKIDEAAAAVQLFERLRSAAQRTLFEAQQGHEEYLPRLPSETGVQLAATQMLADPGLQVRIALLAGALFEPAPPAALLPAAPEAPTAPAPAPESAAGDEEPAEGDEPADEEAAPGASERAAEAPGGGRKGNDMSPADLQAKIGKLIEAIRGRKWGPAEAQVRHFPPAIKDHWTTVLRKARTANDVISTITHDTLDQAARIAEDIDCLPVREGLDERIAYLRNGLPPRPAPEPPQRRERRPPPLAAPAQERAELPPPLPAEAAPVAPPATRTTLPPPPPRRRGGA